MFDGKLAVVTGAGNPEAEPGIGRTIALLLAEQGAEVVCVTRTEVNCAATRDAIGAGATAIAADVSRLDEVKRLAAQLARVDLLVNVVHLASRTGLSKQTEESWQQALHTNASSLLYLVQELPLADGASVLNVGTIWSNRALVVDGKLAQRHAYAAGKAAASALVRTLAVELAPRRIRVNQLSIGFVRSPLVDRAIERAGAQGDDVHRARDHMTLQREQATPRDAARAALALLSPWATLINGQDVAADGGASVVCGSLAPPDGVGLRRECSQLGF